MKEQEKTAEGGVNVEEMTLPDLLDSLEREFKKLMPQCRIYKAKLPQSMQDAQDKSPYVLITLGSGKDVEFQSHTEVMVTFGVLEDLQENLGYRKLLELVENTRQWAKEKTIDRRYSIKGDIGWKVYTKENLPCFFAEVLFKAELPYPVPKLLTKEGF